MDWPLAAVITGMGGLVCAAGIGAVVMIRDAPVPAPKQFAFSIELSPGVDMSTSVLSSRPDILPTQPLDPEPVEMSEPETSVASAEPTAPAPAPKPKKAPAPHKAPPETSGKAVPPERKKTASLEAGPPPKASAPPKAAPPVHAPPPVVEKWQVLPTAKASMFNLGGHIDKNGIVDGMATPHLKEALMKHRNFGKLPPVLQAHVAKAPNIDLNKLAAYRGLLGMEDSMMETQGVRFVRIAQR